MDLLFTLVYFIIASTVLYFIILHAVKQAISESLVDIKKNMESKAKEVEDNNLE